VRAEEPAQGKLLIAQPSLHDPNFQRSVVLLLGYGPGGAMGLIINRPAQTPMADVLGDVDDLATEEDELFWSGPVTSGEVFLVLRAANTPDGAARVFDDVHVTRRIELLRRLLAGGDPSRFRVFVGYAGWAGGQLDAEIERGDWSVRAADPSSVFDPAPETLWERLVPPNPSAVAWLGPSTLQAQSSAIGGSARASSSHFRTGG
jgi:putative transcriptional regulator